MLAQLLPGFCSRFLTRFTVSSPSEQEGSSLTLQGPPCSLSEGLQAVRGGAGLVVGEAAMARVLVLGEKGSLFRVKVEIGLRSGDGES